MIGDSSTKLFVFKNVLISAGLSDCSWPPIRIISFREAQKIFSLFFHKKMINQSEGEKRRWTTCGTDDEMKVLLLGKCVVYFVRKSNENIKNKAIHNEALFYFYF